MFAARLASFPFEGELKSKASTSEMKFTSRQWQQGLDRTPEDVAQAYAALTTDQVANAMNGMWLDHGYLLAPLAGAEVQG